MLTAPILIISFLVTCLIGFPIGASALIASLLYIFINPGINLSVVTQIFVGGMDDYSLLAIPFFVLAGNIMNYGGVTDRIFYFCSALVGHVPGGLGHVNVLGSMIFAGMSGSGTADAAGLGSIEIRAMKNEGYDTDFTACVTAASACIGPIIPPSIPALVYAVQAGISTGGIYAAGLIQGVAKS
ncbi:MAG: TRAP transporter large permease subunit, partial [Clostridiaceae bacterium]|nr:TRAP transporter large permease subunit [Clostridiaceae bacterium]